jgi:hypothetical protein
LQGFLVIIKRFNRILPKKLPNKKFYQNFTKKYFYQISIKIVEILPKVKKYTEYGHTGFGGKIYPRCSGDPTASLLIIYANDNNF